jgi:hypothetical protein
VPRADGGPARAPVTAVAEILGSGDPVDALIGVIGAAMERWNTPPGVPPAEVAAVVLAMFQGLVRQRRIDPDRVSGDLFARGLRWLFSGMGSVPPGAER